MDSSEYDDPPQIGFRFVIGVLQVELHIPLCHSLKEKRGILAHAMNQVRKEFPVSMAEVGYHDDWDRAGLAAVVINVQGSVADRILRGALAQLGRSREFEVVHDTIELI